jgi:hypothetical protein
MTMNQQPTMQPTSEQIAVCAYLIWEKQGRPHGRHETHWLQAEKQLKADLAQEAGVLTAPPVTESPQPKRRKKSNSPEVVGGMTTNAQQNLKQVTATA